MVAPLAESIIQWIVPFSQYHMPFSIATWWRIPQKTTGRRYDCIRFERVLYIELDVILQEDDDQAVDRRCQFLRGIGARMAICWKYSIPNGKWGLS